MYAEVAHLPLERTHALDAARQHRTYRFWLQREAAQRTGRCNVGFACLSKPQSFQMLRNAVSCLFQCVRWSLAVKVL
jgi:hypothetical protein